MDLIGHWRLDLKILKKIKIKVTFLYLFTSFIFADEITLVDVRSLEEVKTGIIQDAIHIEWTVIEEEIINIDVSKDHPIFLYCRSGNRSGKAEKILEKLGYTNITNAGSIQDAAKKLDKKIVKYSE